MSIYEYDEEKHMRLVKEEGIAQGEKNKLLKLIQRKLEKGKSISQIADELEESEEMIKILIEEQEKQR